VRRNVRRSGQPAAALLIIALLSAVLLGGVQEAACAMHGLGAAHAGAATVRSAPAGHVAHARQISHDRGRHSHDDGTHGCDCSCISSCTMTAPVATAPTAVVLHLALIEPEPRLPVDVEPAQSPAREPDRLLPFANGPPSSASV